jgi:multiple sugar transport system permease protein
MDTSTVAVPTTVAKVKKAKMSYARRREAFYGILCASPIILGFLLWQLIPIVASFVLGFATWAGYGPITWGPQNFIKIFTNDPLFIKSLQVTITYTVASVPFRLILAFALAMLLNQQIILKPIFRTLFYLPSIVPTVASSFVWMWMFNPDFGLFNLVLKTLFGLPPTMQWIYSSKTVIPSLVLMSAWDIGATMIIFLAGLQGVPRYLYEAVEVDGGNAWHRLWYVTIPMMTPTIFFNFILGLIGGMQTFAQGYIMTQGGPGNNSLFYVLYLYNHAFRMGEMGFASALAFILFTIIAILSFIVFRTSSLWVYYEAQG